jgi:hypothetical protein
MRNIGKFAMAVTLAATAFISGCSSDQNCVNGKDQNGNDCSSSYSRTGSSSIVPGGARTKSSSVDGESVGGFGGAHGEGAGG